MRREPWTVFLALGLRKIDFEGSTRDRLKSDRAEELVYRLVTEDLPKQLASPS